MISENTMFLKLCRALIVETTNFEFMISKRNLEFLERYFFMGERYSTHSRVVKTRDL